MRIAAASEVKSIIAHPRAENLNRVSHNFIPKRFHILPSFARQNTLGRERQVAVSVKTCRFLESKLAHRLD